MQTSNVIILLLAGVCLHTALFHSWQLRHDIDRRFDTAVVAWCLFAAGYYGLSVLITNGGSDAAITLAERGRVAIALLMAPVLMYGCMVIAGERRRRLLAVVAATALVLAVPILTTPLFVSSTVLPYTNFFGERIRFPKTGPLFALAIPYSVVAIAACIAALLRARTSWRAERFALLAGLSVYAVVVVGQVVANIIVLSVPPAFAYGFTAVALAFNYIAVIRFRRLRTELETEVAARTVELTDKNEQLSTALGHARRASEAKGEFLATMSHELRTPLNGILGTAELLRDTPLDDEQRELVDVIVGSGTELTDTIGEILEYVDAGGGRAPHVIEQAEFPLAILVAQAVEQYRDIARLKGLVMTYDVGDVPPVVLGDAAKVRQVVEALAENAVKFTEEGRVAVNLTASGGRVCVEVEDTGIGVATSDRESIFEAFTQADSSASRRHGGTGIGLAVCRELCRLMGGDVTVRSCPGEGSTFTATFDVGLPGHDAAAPGVHSAS